MNEEDIKILEQYIKSSFRLTLPENVLQAIENVINRNKELEEIINIQDEQIKIICDDSIPKSKIREKIEELNKDIEDYLKTDKSGRFTRTNCIFTYKKEALQELLEGK